MNKKTFLTQLHAFSKKIPNSERQVILQDYEEYFMIGVGEGKTESQIVEAIGAAALT